MGPLEAEGLESERSVEGMTVRVAISGFGRIGRNVFRALYARDDLEVVAINDIADPKSMEYLLRFDSLHGPFSEPVRILENNLYAKGRRIPVLHFTEPGEVPWYDYGADVVVEATGRYRTRDALQKHLDMGAARVILSTAPADDIDAIHIRGVTPGELPPPVVSVIVFLRSSPSKVHSMARPPGYVDVSSLPTPS